jgi:hypothetical protein
VGVRLSSRVSSRVSVTGGGVSVTGGGVSVTCGGVSVSSRVSVTVSVTGGRRRRRTTARTLLQEERHLRVQQLQDAGRASASQLEFCFPFRSR